MLVPILIFCLSISSLSAGGPSTEISPDAPAMLKLLQKLTQEKIQQKSNAKDHYVIREINELLQAEASGSDSIQQKIESTCTDLAHEFNSRKRENQELRAMHFILAFVSTICTTYAGQEVSNFLYGYLDNREVATPLFNSDRELSIAIHEKNPEKVRTVITHYYTGILKAHRRALQCALAFTAIPIGDMPSSPTDIQPIIPIPTLQNEAVTFEDINIAHIILDAMDTLDEMIEQQERESTSNICRAINKKVIDDLSSQTLDVSRLKFCTKEEFDEGMRKLREELDKTK